jgi:hypothetical protein
LPGATTANTTTYITINTTTTATTTSTTATTNTANNTNTNGTTTNTPATPNVHSTMVTKTQRIKATLLLDGHPKSVLSEHIRAMIRMYGIGGIKDGATEQLFYEILFLDPLTTRHFGRFQRMWEQHNSTAQPYLEWWTQFRAFLRDCLDKTRAGNNRYQLEKWTAYSANADDFYDSPAFDWLTLATDADAWV